MISTSVPVITTSPTIVAAALAPPSADTGDPAPVTENTAASSNGPLSISQEVDNIANQIRQAPTEEEANNHVLATARMANEIRSKISSDSRNALIYSTFESAMLNLNSAAKAKAQWFHPWNADDAKSKILIMESQLIAAQGMAQTTDRELQNERDPALAAQRKRELANRVRFYERQGR
ncbi:hypothetical protein EON83_11260 [bacterium]|nr:MAG: hypothetical protein EON83_11260 [bacterium]